MHRSRARHAQEAVVTSSSSPGDDISSLIRRYNAMEDPQLRSDFLEARGLTSPGWKAMVATYERGRRRSTNASQNKPSSTNGHVPVVVVRVEIRSRERFRSAPPTRGIAGSGPGRKRSGGERRQAVRIVITLSEE
jgi:hypothetical protein